MQCEGGDSNVPESFVWVVCCCCCLDGVRNERRGLFGCVCIKARDPLHDALRFHLASSPVARQWLTARVRGKSQESGVFGLLFQAGHGDLGWNRYSTHLVFRVNSTHNATIKSAPGAGMADSTSIDMTQGHTSHTISGKDPHCVFSTHIS